MCNVAITIVSSSPRCLSFFEAFFYFGELWWRMCFYLNLWMSDFYSSEQMRLLKTGGKNKRVPVCLPFLPQSWKWKMGPSNISFLSSTSMIMEARVGSLGMKYYPVIWVLCQKPWNKHDVMKQPAFHGKYTRVNQHSKGKSILWRFSFWTWGYSIAMLVYQRARPCWIFFVGGSGNRQFPDDTLTMVQPEVLATGLVLSGAVGGDNDTGALWTSAFFRQKPGMTGVMKCLEDHPT